MKVLTCASVRFDKINEHYQVESHATEKRSEVLNSVSTSLSQWKPDLADLIDRQHPSWNSKHRQVAKVPRILTLDTGFGIRSYLAESECVWDAGRLEYEEALGLLESLLSDRTRFPEDGVRPLSLDFGMIYCHHTLAWKCQWPHLRRRGLELLRRIRGREWILDAEKYYKIFCRIMEIEEAHLHLPPNEIPGANDLPPESVRIHHFTVKALSPPIEFHNHAVTFWSKPQGLGGPWHSRTELMQLTSSQRGESAVPVNLMNRYFARPGRLKPVSVLQEKDIKASFCSKQMQDTWFIPVDKMHATLCATLLLRG